jgi:hypothetical protein
MNIFEEDFRTIGTRGIVLSKEQMENFRIKKILNSVGDSDFLTDEDAELMSRNFNERGEFCLIEATLEKNVYKISLLTFEDIWSRNVFALINKEYYEGCPDLITLNN